MSSHVPYLEWGATSISTAETNQCDLCQAALAGPATLWRRRLPTQEELRTCDVCVDRLLLLADDHAHGDGDEMRVAGLFATLAGEIWAAGDRVLWFRSPFYHHNISPDDPALKPRAAVTSIPRSASRSRARSRSASGRLS